MHRIQTEISHYYSLPEKARRLILSFLFYGMTYSLTGTFINAFIWRHDQGLRNVAIYNFGQFIGVPLLFYLNGFFLRKVKINVLYFLGSLISGISALLVVFFSHFSPFIYLIYGIIYGVGVGFYWANRNYLVWSQTHSKIRSYFLGLGFSLDTLTGILIPVVVGWFLALGWLFGFSSIQTSYQIAVVFTFLLLFIAGFIVLRTDFPSPNITTNGLSHISSQWNRVRVIVISQGFMDGVNAFLPSFLILSAIGTEGVLGTLSSFASLLSAIFIYIYGRKAESRHQRPTFFITGLVGLVTAFILFFKYNAASVFLYTSLYGTILYFQWMATGPLFMDIMDSESGDNEANRYWLVYDQELFLNLGRLFCIGLMLIFLLFFAQTFVMIFIPLLTYTMQLVLASFVWKKIR